MRLVDFVLPAASAGSEPRQVIVTSAGIVVVISDSTARGASDGPSGIRHPCQGHGKLLPGMIVSQETGARRDGRQRREVVSVVAQVQGQAAPSHFDGEHEQPASATIAGIHRSPWQPGPLSCTSTPVWEFSVARCVSAWRTQCADRVPLPMHYSPAMSRKIAPPAFRARRGKESLHAGVDLTRRLRQVAPLWRKGPRLPSRANEGFVL